MRDGFTIGDGLAAELACGHPNVRPNEECPLCGKIVREQQTISAGEVGSVEEILGDLNAAMGEKE
jgi:hypothetical protein